MATEGRAEVDEITLKFQIRVDDISGEWWQATNTINTSSYIISFLYESRDKELWADTQSSEFILPVKVDCFYLKALIERKIDPI